MVYRDGRLYAVADLQTGLAVTTAAWNQRQVSFPYAKVQLPGNPQLLSRHPQPSAKNFGAIQSPSESGGRGNHICVNFKFDEFCFANAGDGRRPDNLDYFRGADGIWDNSDPTHWFFRIRHLRIVASPGRRLTAFDRGLLTRHPTLETVAIVVTPSAVQCEHPVARFSVVPRVGGSRIIERMPLDRFNPLLATLEACGCGARQAHVQALESLRQELVDLSGQHYGEDGMRARPPTVRIEVEMTESERVHLLLDVAAKEELEAMSAAFVDIDAAFADMSDVDADAELQTSIMQEAEHEFSGQ